MQFERFEAKWPDGSRAIIEIDTAIASGRRALSFADMEAAIMSKDRGVKHISIAKIDEEIDKAYAAASRRRGMRTRRQDWTR
jgi:hypothetical protein